MTLNRAWFRKMGRAESQWPPGRLADQSERAGWVSYIITDH